MTIKDVLTTIKTEFPSISARWIVDTQEYRITYKGMSKDDAESVACYTDDYNDAIGTARYMHTVEHKVF